MFKATLTQKVKALFSDDCSTTFDREVELWANLYHLTRQQQKFALAMLPLLENLQSPLLEQAQAIIELDTILDYTETTLQAKQSKVKDPTIQKRIARLLNL